MKLTRILSLVTTLALSAQALFAAENLKVAQELPGVWAGKAAWADYDQDGFLDLALTGITVENNAAVRIARIYRNTGEAGGGLLDTAPAEDLDGVYYGDLAWADYDGDLDLAIAGWAADGTETLKLYRNDPTGTLVLDQEETEILGVGGLIGVRYASIAWQDYDNDADPDLIVSGMNSNGVALTQLYTNDDGTFEPDEFNSETVLNVQNGDVAWGDYDGDGDLDLFAGGNAGSSLTTVLYQNDGGALAALDGTSFPGIRGGDLALGDYDNDQFMDLVIVGNNGSTSFMSIYRNQLGSLETPDTPFEVDSNLANLQAAQGVDFSAVSMADIDGDRDLDLFSAGRFDVITAAPLTTVNDNIVAAANILPGVPPGIVEEVDRNAVSLSWGAATESPAPHSVTYNLRVGTEPEAHDVLSGNVPLGTGNAGTNLTHRLAGLISGTYYWSVQAVDDGFARSPWSTPRSFVIDTVRPQTGAPNFSRLRAGIGQTIAAVLEFQDAHSGIDPSVDPVVTATVAGETYAFQQLQFSGSIWSGELTITGDMPSGVADLAVTSVVDELGNEILPDTTSASFEIDTIVPAVSTASPDAGAASVSSDTDVVIITLSEPIDGTTASTDNFRIELDNQSVALVTGEPEYDGDVTISLFSEGGLSPGTEYSVSVAAGIQDLFGNRPDVDTTWTFTTVIPDTALVTPAAGATGVVAADADIRAVFDSPIIASAVSEATVQLLQEGEPVTINPGYSSETMAISLNPLSQLLPGTPYQVVVSGVVGGPLRQNIGDFEWGFSTLVPTVDRFTPGEAAEIASGDQRIALYFSSPIDPVILADYYRLSRGGVSVPLDASGFNYVSDSLQVLFPTVRLEPGSQYEVSVSSRVRGPLAAEEPDLQWTFTTTVPEIVDSDPDDGAVDVDVDESDLSIEFDTPPSSSVTGAVQLFAQGVPVDIDEVEYRDANTITFEPLTDDLKPGTTYQIRIAAAAGGPLREEDYVHTFTTAIPDTVSVTPAANATSVLLPLTSVEVVFSSAIDEEALLAPGNVVVLESGTQLENLDLRPEDATVTITPAGGFHPGTPYELFVSGAVGGPLRQAIGDFRWNFSTQVPDVDLVSPLDGSEVVAGDRRISVTFTSQVDPGLAENSDLYDVTQGGNPVQLDGQFSYDADNLRVQFPELNLGPGRQYEVSVSSQLGGPLGADRADTRWSFRTSVPALVESGVVPGFGAAEVAIDSASFRVQFDAPPDSSVTEVVELLNQGVTVDLTQPSYFDQTTITFAPLSGILRAGTPYQIRIGASAGGPLRQEDYTWSFSTAIPTLQQVSPAPGTEVDHTGLEQLQITFTGPVDADKVDSAFNLTRNGTAVSLREGDPVPLDEEGRVFGLAPADGWQVGSAYAIAVSPEISGPTGPGPDCDERVSHRRPHSGRCNANPG